MSAMLEAAKAAKLLVPEVLLSAGRSSRPAGPLIKSSLWEDALITVNP